MTHKKFTRRRFIKQSITGSLVMGQLASGSVSSRAITSAMAAGKNGLRLKVIGDALHGYTVAVLINSEPFVEYKRGGEFSAVFQNEDRSVEDRVEVTKRREFAASLVLHERLAAYEHRDIIGCVRPQSLWCLNPFLPAAIADVIALEDTEPEAS